MSSESKLNMKLAEAKRLVALVQVVLHKALKEPHNSETHIKRALELLSCENS